MRINNTSELADKVRKNLESVIIARYIRGNTALGCECIYVESYGDTLTANITFDEEEVSIYNNDGLYRWFTYKDEKSVTQLLMDITRALTFLGF